MQIPKNECVGCNRRDEIIQSLATRIDELEAQERKLELVAAVEKESEETAAA